MLRNTTLGMLLLLVLLLISFVLLIQSLALDIVLADLYAATAWYTVIAASVCTPLYMIGIAILSEATQLSFASCS
jgi:hypothetical protein